MIIGTAGHIDHGKTLLVKALTGVDTDRLKEEKERGITIELGFAYAPIPGGGVLGFVDVPGHERFVHTMLAGAAGIDFVLLVVAADDGVMPQTREHVHVLDLLGLSEGLVVITKSDLVDATRIEEVAGEVHALLAGTGLAGLDLLAVSAATGAGIEALRQRLADEAASRPERGRTGFFRLAIDRAFTLAGAGTVVTGTVLAGRVAVGDRVVVLPQRLEARVRSLHAQNAAAEAAVAGQRCALSLVGPGISKEAVARGDWLNDPANAGVSERIDARIRLLEGEPRPLKTWSPVYLHVGTSAEPARIILLSADTLEPGGSALAQIVLPRPLPLRHGDRLVLRDIGAQRTIGGGRVLDIHPPQRRRRTPERLALLAALDEPDPGLALLGVLALEPGIVDLAAFAADRGHALADVVALTDGLELALVGPEESRHALLPETWQRLKAAMVAALTEFHAKNPDLPGMPLERLRLAVRPRLPKPQSLLVAAAAASEGTIVVQGSSARLPGHSTRLAPADERMWRRIRELIEAERYRPPTAREMAEHLGQPVAKIRSLCKTLARMGVLTEIAADRFFLAGTLVEMAVMATELAAAASTRTFTAAEFKDRAECGRNVGIQVLEYFDRRGFTLRQGDARRVVKSVEAVFGGRG